MEFGDDLSIIACVGGKACFMHKGLVRRVWGSVKPPNRNRPDQFPINPKASEINGLA